MPPSSLSEWSRSVARRVLRCAALPAFLAAAVQTGGCWEAADCDSAGCTNAASITLPVSFEGPLTVEVCRNAVCSTVTVEAGEDESLGGALSGSVSVREDETSTRLNVWVHLSDPRQGDVYSVHAWTEADGMVADFHGVAEYEKLQPNGPDCPRTCHAWRVEI